MTKNAGFNLIEMMVVVAIIGILAAVAIPNYQLQQARSRQSEVKLNLAALYTAEQAVYAEQHSFTACFTDIGYTPITNYYMIDLTPANWNACGISSNASCLGTFPGGNPTPCSQTSGGNQALATNLTYPKTAGVPTVTPCQQLQGAGATCTISTNAFTAAALAKISNNPSNPQHPYDVWSIDQNNNLLNVIPGY